MRSGLRLAALCTVAHVAASTSGRAELVALRESAARHPSAAKDVTPELDLACKRFAPCFVGTSRQRHAPKWCDNSPKVKAFKEELDAIGIGWLAPDPGMNTSRSEFAERLCPRLRSCASYADGRAPATCKPERAAIARKILHHMKSQGLEDKATLARDTYAAAAPFPNAFFDGLFPESILRKVHAEVPDGILSEAANVTAAAAARGWGLHNEVGGGNLKAHNADERLMGPTLQGVIEAMKAPLFVRFLERLTGIDHLLVDPTNSGAGVHQIARGGSLQIHADFNMQSPTFHRRVNVFLHLNPDWDASWGGDLELWDRSMTRCAARVATTSNRLAIFSTTDFSYHGHADPLACPAHRSRRSIAMYYYTTSRPLSEVVVDESGQPIMHSTLYQTRKCESCMAARCRK